VGRWLLKVGGCGLRFEFRLSKKKKKKEEAGVEKSFKFLTFSKPTRIFF